MSDLCPDFETTFKETILFHYTIYIATEVFKFTIFLDQSLVISLFACLFILGGFRPTREFFTHMEMSPLPGKGSKF